MVEHIHKYSNYAIELAETVLSRHPRDETLTECFYKIKTIANNAPIELIEKSWPYLWRERKSIMSSDINSINDINTDEAKEYDTINYIVETIKSDWNRLSMIDKENYKSKVKDLLTIGVHYHKHLKNK